MWKVQWISAGCPDFMEALVGILECYELIASATQWFRAPHFFFRVFAFVCFQSSLQKIFMVSRIHTKKGSMNRAGDWTWYPRGQYAFGQIGPALQPEVFTSRKPPTIVAAKPNEALEYKPTTSGFTANKWNDAYQIKQAVGFKQADSIPYLNPTLTPLANFSVPVTEGLPTKSINLSDDLNTKTENLKGMSLLTAIMAYIQKVNVFELNVKEFESVLKACERLSLPADAQQAGLKAEYDQDITDNEFYKLQIWLLATPGTDPAIKRGFIKIVPGNTLSAMTALAIMPRWKMVTNTRTARVPIEIKTAADIELYGRAVEDEAEESGVVLPNRPSLPNLATGQDGDISTGPDDTFDDTTAREARESMFDILLKSAREASGVRKTVQDEQKELPPRPTPQRAFRVRPVAFSKTEQTALDGLPVQFDLKTFDGMTPTDTLNQFSEEGSAVMTELIKRRRAAGMDDGAIVKQIKDYIKTLGPAPKRKQTKGKSIKDRY